MTGVLPARLPVVATWLTMPLALTQGLWLRRTALRLPEAEGLSGSIGDAGDPLRVVVVGDSVAAGVGLVHHDQSMAGLVSRGLAAAHGRASWWTVIARSGATAGSARDLLLGRPELAEADVVLVSIGVNDTKNLHGVERFRRELGELLDTVLAGAPRAQVLLFGIPPMEQLPALPRTLAGFLGKRSRVMDAVSDEVAAARPRVRRVVGDLLAPDGLVGNPFADDGIHPSGFLHRRFADAVLATLS